MGRQVGFGSEQQHVGIAQEDDVLAVHVVGDALAVAGGKFSHHDAFGAVEILLLAKAGKKKGCLIEGMACPGGCVAGAGTNIAIPEAQKCVAGFKEAAKERLPKKE